MVQEIDVTDTIQDKIVSKICHQQVEDVYVDGDRMGMGRGRERGDDGGYCTGRRINQFNEEEENDGNV